jgi:hypothetical protein
MLSAILLGQACVELMHVHKSIDTYDHALPWGPDIDTYTDMRGCRLVTVYEGQPVIHEPTFLEDNG